MGIFTHQAVQSRGSWEECPSISQTEAAEKVSVGEAAATDKQERLFWLSLTYLFFSSSTLLWFLERLLVPQMVKLKGKVHFTDAFCGAYFTFALSKEGHVYGFGLSNYHQLGELTQKSLAVVISDDVNWNIFVSGITLYCSFCIVTTYCICFDHF